MPEHKFQFGVHVKDVISGLSGYVTGRVTYMTGCTQYIVQPTLGGDGKYREGHWVDGRAHRQQRLPRRRRGDRPRKPRSRSAPEGGSRLMSRSTHTYAVLEVSTGTYSEIRGKLEAAGYQHAFHETAATSVRGSGIDVATVEVIDMHGIALADAGCAPLPLVIHCPHCHLQHVDVDDDTGKWATSRLHRKHLCKPSDGGCGHVWAPANVHTVGVAELPGAPA